MTHKSTVQRSFWCRLTEGGLVSYLAVFVCITLVYLITCPIWSAGVFPSRRVLGWIGAGLLLAGGCAALFFRKKERWSTRTALLLLVAAGLLLRVVYMLYTPFSLRGHDLGGANGTGHAGYIWYLYQNGELPFTNTDQFYHPPLMHLLSALWCKVFHFLTGWAQPNQLLDTVKILSTMASVSVLLTGVKLFDYFKLKGSALLTATAVLAFCPSFLIFSASINNDILMIALYVAAFYRTLLWWDKPTLGNILWIAATIGLAMMAKTSGASVAFFTAAVFLAMLIRVMQNRRANQTNRLQKHPLTPAQLIGQFAAFLGVCAPLGLWYPIRNLVRFDQPFSYVLRIPTTEPIYCGDHTIMERFFSVPFDRMLQTPYCLPQSDYNLWLYTASCATFGEFGYSDPWSLVLADILLVLHTLVMVGALAAMIYVLWRGKGMGLRRFAPALLWGICMFAFVLFNIAYPYGCTMDFRYLAPTAVCGAIYLGMARQLAAESKKPVATLCTTFMTIFVVLFCVACAAFYLL